MSTSGAFGSRASVASDGATGLQSLIVAGVEFNETTWDRVRNNTLATLLPSAARTTTTASPTQTNYNARGILVVLNVTAASGTGGLTIRVRAIMSDSTDIVLNPDPTAVTATGVFTYLVYPGAGADARLTQVTGVPVPRSFYVQVAVGDASSYTYDATVALVA